MSDRARNALDAACLLLLPVVLVVCAVLRLQASALLTLAAAIASLALFFAGWERDEPPLRQLMPTAVLAAVAVAGRIVLAAVPNVQPVTAICVVAGAVFGRRCGFMVGAMTGLVSSFFLGVGAWTPWQMYAWGVAGYVAGMLFMSNRRSKQRTERNKANVSVLAYGFVASFAFGFVMNTWTLVGFVNPITWESALAVYGAGFAFDLAHAISTVVFLAIIYVPWGRKLRRVTRKYAL